MENSGESSKEAAGMVRSAIFVTQKQMEKIDKMVAIERIKGSIVSRSEIMRRAITYYLEQEGV